MLKDFAPYHLLNPSPWRDFDKLVGFTSLKNRYFLCLHGESELSIQGTVACLTEPGQSSDPLTAEGQAKVRSQAQQLQHSGLLNSTSLICADPFARTMQSAEILVSVAGSRPAELDKRLRDRRLQFKDFQRTQFLQTEIWDIDRKNPWCEDIGFENVAFVLQRMTRFIADMESKHQNRSIFIVTHLDPGRILREVMAGRNPRCHSLSAPLSPGSIEELILDPAQRVSSPDPNTETASRKNPFWRATTRRWKYWMRAARLFASPKEHVKLASYDLPRWFSNQEAPAEKTRTDEGTTSDSTQVHLCFFTCGTHFNYILAALSSLEMISSPYLGRVFVYVDNKSPLSASQEETLKQLSLDLTLAKGDRSTGWGARSIINQLQYLRSISHELPATDYLAKIDSDVMFFSGRVFESVVNSEADLYGHPFVNTYARGPRYVYPQGGGYFVRNSLWGRLKNQRMIPVIWEGGNRVATPYPMCPEDAGFFNLLRRYTDNVYLEEYFAPPSRLDSLVPAEESWYSAVHFERLWVGHLRDKMLDFLERWNCNSAAT